jgi:hypothetical protein
VGILKSSRYFPNDHATSSRSKVVFAAAMFGPH